MDRNNTTSGMRKAKAALALIVAIGMTALAFHAAGRRSSPTPPFPTLPAASPLPADDDETQGTMRFLAYRIKQDPGNFVALNMLAGCNLQRLRETGSLDSLERAQSIARASLAVIPADRNVGGLSALTQAEFASHEFARARDHALRLTRLEPAKSAPYGTLGDALLELGDYPAAAAAYGRMQHLGGGVATETRLARFAALHGDLTLAQRHYADAIAFALDLPIPPRETVAWCRWQLGETAFAAGDYATAEQCDRDALTTFPGYYRALASLGRVRAARGDLPGAITDYERAVNIIPDPTFVAALGDLYQIAGRKQDAAAQYALVEEIGHLTKISGALYNRQLALFYADHDLKPAVAYTNAVREYALRRDIYGADTLAWAALKAGKVGAARKAITDALRLGTQDARLFYHAGMIARAAGDRASARAFLQRALALSPQFDPRQAPIARRALVGIDAAEGTPGSA